MPTAYQEDPYEIGYTLIEDGRTNLLLNAPIPFAGPAHFLHGLADDDVPWTVSVNAAERLISKDVSVTLVKGRSKVGLRFAAFRREEPEIIRTVRSRG